MNGQYAIKGYLYQSLIALLESFNTDWKTVCVEPNDESEKVDVRWTFSDDTKKVVQIKSSKNLITLPMAKSWANDLKSETPDAYKYELVLIGSTDNRITDELNEVSITKKNLTIDEFETLILGKINVFFEGKGKNIVAPKLGRLFARALNQGSLIDSITGCVLSRSEFETNLLDLLQTTERHLEKCSYGLLLPDTPSEGNDIETVITDHILKLIGWSSLSKNETVTIYNERLGTDESFSVDFWGDYESPLKDKQKDIIYIKSNIEAEYHVDCADKIKYNTFCVDSVRNNLIERGRIKTDDCTEHSVQFVLSLKDSEQGQANSELNTSYRSKSLNKDLIYYAVDNRRADFLISSIITARKYRADLITKFLYPITEDNLQIDKIGKRGTYLPPQYLTSSILPIIKESDEKISVLLFCSDSYRKDRLRKIIWLLIRLTSGLATEYKIYFPDFNSQYNNEVAEVLRSYNNNDLTNRIKIEILNLCNSSELQIVPPNTSGDLIDEEFVDSRNISKALKIQPHLMEYLPYGDNLKPFLASDAVKSEDLKLFLQNKGIYFKTADKTKIIQLMTSMLFSSLDIDSLVEVVNVNEKPMDISSIQYPLLKTNTQVKQLSLGSIINQDRLSEGLRIDIASVQETTEKNSANTFELTIYIEQNNPNKQALVNTTRSTAKITAKIDTTTDKLEFTKEYNSSKARAVAERAVKQLADSLIRNNYIEDNAIEVRFSDFSNRDRINFLLSFTNIESSSTFKRFDAKSFKYMFDESVPLPAEYADKKGKKCITKHIGQNLDTIKELQEESLKQIILGEELIVNYRYSYRGISGNYYVKMNFSDAFKNQPTPDGIFNIKPTVYIDSRDKEKVTNIQSLESDLKKEFNQFKKEKLQQFNMI